MNVTLIDHATFVETIGECEILSILEGPGVGQTYIAVRDGANILVISDTMTGGAMIVHACNDDREAGGSIHDHARSISC